MRRALAGLFLAILLVPSLASAHCEVPCGIFSDALRIEILEEHVTTIEKAMNQIVALSEEDDEDFNQIVRWVTTKDEHAEDFQHIVSQYFLHQRIKPAGADDAEYVQKLTLLHEMLVSAMRCKQGTDTTHTDNLRALIASFSEAYFSPEELQHLREH